MRPWLEMQKAERDQNWPSCPWVFHYLGKPIGGHIKGYVDACVKAGYRSFAPTTCDARQ
jgi:hypothetical protein